MTEPLYILRGTQYIEAGSIDMDAMHTPEPIPDPPTVGTDAELRAAVEAWEPGGEPIYVRDGTYAPIDVPEGKHGLALLAAPASSPRVSGLVPFAGSWVAQGEIIAASYAGFAGRSWHWSKSAGAGNAHRLSACPDLFAIDDGEDRFPLQLVHRPEDLTPGSYMIALAGGDINRPTHVLVSMPAGYLPEHIHHAPTPFLFRADGCNGVRLYGFEFEFCGNTHKLGAVQITGQGWDVDVEVSHAMVGLSVRGTGHNLGYTYATGCFQLGFLLDGCHDSTFPGCAANDNNTRGANARWEAGGLKGVNSTGNTFGTVDGRSEFSAVRNLGPGHWMDISCHRTRVHHYTGHMNAAACIQIEHYMDDGEYTDIQCTATRPYWLESDRTDALGLQGPAGKEKIGSLWTQSNINRLKVRRARFDSTPLAVKIKEHESRGVVRDCLFDEFEYGPGVVQRKSIERFNDAQIRAAINQGAKPGTLAEWQAVRNTYGASV